MGENLMRWWPQLTEQDKHVIWYVLSFPPEDNLILAKHSEVVRGLKRIIKLWNWESDKGTLARLEAEPVQWED